VTALRLLDPGRENVPLRRLAGLMTPAGWANSLELGRNPGAPVSDLVLGTAGVVLAAVWAGGATAAGIAAGGGEALLRVAEPAVAGLDWRLPPGGANSTPNYSHGTAGVAAALAVAGQALGRDDFIEPARQGAEYLLAVAQSAVMGSPSRTPCPRRPVTWSRSPTPGAMGRPAPRSCSRRWPGPVSPRWPGTM
jgi:hypothetical protein